ncbi:hypothetical protein K435DRAFT_797476 [Dendrothele bispora CBS 962.96]|uniref:Uncharacterized protein n=1 Tax=Dendrothele bispora (strain CBS 962.96) TaxID=1314807 RepID=A0A4S8M2C0_DENBC|nr:hypothetical protein K435DRAFT_797476 [Dendrothele bispora CBS 962.96]
MLKMMTRVPFFPLRTKRLDSKRTAFRLRLDLFFSKVHHCQGNASGFVSIAFSKLKQAGKSREKPGKSGSIKLTRILMRDNIYPDEVYRAGTTDFSTSFDKINVLVFVRKIPDLKISHWQFTKGKSSLQITPSTSDSSKSQRIYKRHHSIGELFYVGTSLYGYKWLRGVSNIRVGPVLPVSVQSDFLVGKCRVATEKQALQPESTVLQRDIDIPAVLEDAEGYQNFCLTTDDGGNSNEQVTPQKSVGHAEAVYTRPECREATEKQALQPESRRDIDVSAVLEDAERHQNLCPTTDDGGNSNEQVTLQSSVGHAEAVDTRPEPSGFAPFSLPSLPTQVDTSPGPRSALFLPQQPLPSSSSDTCSTSRPTGVKRTKEEWKVIRASEEWKAKKREIKREKRRSEEWKAKQRERKREKRRLARRAKHTLDTVNQRTHLRPPNVHPYLATSPKDSSAYAYPNPIDSRLKVPSCLLPPCLIGTYAHRVTQTYA